MSQKDYQAAGWIQAMH